jgi:hypothetical protein
MIERRVYRAPRLTRVLSWILVLAFFVLSRADLQEQASQEADQLG